MSKGSNEAMFLIEAYRTLRDRGPYPADQVLKELDGTFAFVVYDSRAGAVFAALVLSLSVSIYLSVSLSFKLGNLAFTKYGSWVINRVLMEE